MKLKMILFFLIAQLLGALVGVLLISNSQFIPEFEEMKVTPMGETGSIWNAVFFIFYMLLGAVIFFLLLKYHKGTKIFRGMEFLIILFASSIVFFVLIFSLFPTLGFDTSFLIGFLIAFLLASTKWFTHKARNTAAILSSAGVGAIFGFSLGFIPAVVFMIGLSIYDYIAVFKTKHMVTFAQALSNKNMSFSLQVSEKEETKKTEEVVAVEKYAFKDDKRYKLELGTGDLIIPIMVSVSSYYTFGIFGTISVIIGVTLAFIILIHYIFSRKLFLPALPPLAAGCLLGLAGFYLISLALGL